MGAVDSIPSQKNIREVVNWSTSTGRDSKAKRKFSASSSKSITSLEVKRSKTQVIGFDCKVKGKLMRMSSKVSDVYLEKMFRDGNSKKKDDSPVPFEVWLYWLDTGLKYSLTLQQWRVYGVVVQEKFLLLWWK